MRKDLGSKSGFFQDVSRLWQAEGDKYCFLIETVVLYRDLLLKFLSIKFSIKERVFPVGFPRKLCVIVLYECGLILLYQATKD